MMRQLCARRFVFRWGMASKELMGKLDVLFVDEAGQLPLSQLAGAARSASSIVLLGDQMQLPAPSEGHHPGTHTASARKHFPVLA